MSNQRIVFSSGAIAIGVAVDGALEAHAARHGLDVGRAPGGVITDAGAGRRLRAAWIVGIRRSPEAALEARRIAVALGVAIDGAGDVEIARTAGTASVPLRRARAGLRALDAAVAN